MLEIGVYFQTFKRVVNMPGVTTQFIFFFYQVHFKTLPGK